MDEGSSSCFGGFTLRLLDKWRSVKVEDTRAEAAAGVGGSVGKGWHAAAWMTCDGGNNEAVAWRGGNLDGWQLDRSVGVNFAGVFFL